jgi:hypothetical protein
LGIRLFYQEIDEKSGNARPIRYKTRKERVMHMLEVILLSVLLFGACLCYRSMEKGRRYMLSVGCYVGCLWGILVIVVYEGSSLLQHGIHLLSVFVLWVGIGCTLHIMEAFYKSLWSVMLQASDLSKK